MVPSKRIMPETPPETLPEDFDFGDWEDESSQAQATAAAPPPPAAAPVESRKYEAREREVIPAPREAVSAPREVVSAPREVVSAPREVVSAPREVVSAPKDRAPIQVPPSPAPRTPERPKFAPARTNNHNGANGADADLEAFLRRLSEVNADLPHARRPEASEAANHRTPAVPIQAAVPVRQEPQPAPVKPVPVEAELAQMFRTGYEQQEEAEPEEKKKPKWVLIGAISAAVLVVAAAIAVPLYLRERTITLPHPAPPPSQVLADEVGTTALKPSPSGPASATLSANGNAPKPATANQPATDPAAAPVQTAASVSAAAMNQQLSATSQLPQGARNSSSELPPPPSGFGVAGMDGIGDSGAVGSAFKTQSNIKLAPVKVSAGVAGGLLVRRIAPSYPAIARTARVSGTVVLAATITKTGAVQNLQVVSGPPMLRQSALDAVRNWLYKPYLLNNQPTEVQTTIAVDFSL
jgi:protein TonB